MIKNNKYKKPLYLILATGILIISQIILPKNSFADTVIDSVQLSGENNWVKDKYIINGYVDVPLGSSLRIDSGSEIVFGGASKLMVEGELIAGDSFDSKTTFNFTDTTEPIEFIGGMGTFTNVLFEGGERHIISRTKSSINISSSTFQNVNNSSRSIIENNDRSVLNLSGVIFKNNTANNGIASYNNSTLNIDKSSFGGSYSNSVISAYEVWGGSGSSAFIKDSYLSNPTKFCIESFYNIKTELSGNTIENCKVGISGYNNLNLNVHDNVIRNNTSGIELYGSSVGRLLNVIGVNNAIYGNTDSALISYNGNVNFSNNWWGDESGPNKSIENDSGKGGLVQGQNIITPWLTENPFEKKKCCSNILFIPGIQASRLYRQERGLENKLWEPLTNNDVRKLFLNSDGVSIDSTIYTRDVIGRIPLSLNTIQVYGSFIDQMNQIKGEGRIKDWSPLPYDWRLNPNDLFTKGIQISNGTSTYNVFPENILADLASSSITGKVTLITHSNGALVAKLFIDYLKKENKDSLVDNLIMVAGPEYGTPLSIPSLLHGDGQQIAGGLILKQSVARDMALNMPAAYNLLPTDKFMNGVNQPVVKFNPNLDNYQTLTSAYGDSIKDRATLDKYILANGGDRIKPKSSDTNTANIGNYKLLNDSEVLHTELDNWQAPNDIKTISILGGGLVTVSGIEYFADTVCNTVGNIPIPPFFDGFGLCNLSKVMKREPISTNDGDGTVVIGDRSNRIGDIYELDLSQMNSNNKTNNQHSNIMTTSPILSFIRNIITGTSDAFKNLPEYISHEIYSTSTPIILASAGSLDMSGLRGVNTVVSVHSPVAITVEDKDGKRTGLIATNENEDDQRVIQDIPNSSYLSFGGGKYVFLKDSLDKYKVKLNGLAGGYFTFKTEEKASDGSVTENTYSNIPVTNKLKAELVKEDLISSSTPVGLGSGTAGWQTYSLALDNSGVGNIDEKVLPDDVTLELIASSTIEVLNGSSTGTSTSSTSSTPSTSQTSLSNKQNILNLISILRDKIQKMNVSSVKKIFYIKWLDMINSSVKGDDYRTASKFTLMIVKTMEKIMNSKGFSPIRLFVSKDEASDLYFSFLNILRYIGPNILTKGHKSGNLPSERLRRP